MSNVQIVGANNKPVIVSPRGAMRVGAIGYSEFFHAMTQGRAFQTQARATLTDTSETPLFWLRNDDPREDFLFVLESIDFSSDANVKLELYVDPTAGAYTSGGQDTLNLNLNGGSKLAAEVTAKDNSTGDLTLSLSACAPFERFYSGAYRPFWSEATIAIPKGVAGCMTVTGASGNNVVCHLRYYFMDLAEHSEWKG